MRFASHSMTRLTTLAERPARGGSMTTTSGLPASSISGRIWVRASPARKRAFEIPLMRAFSSASTIASGTTSMPQTSPAFGAIARAIVPIPQKRSKRRSVPLSPAASAAIP